MANFGQVTGQIRARSEKFKKRLATILDTVRPLDGALRHTPDVVLKSTAKFLAGFGTEVARLNKMSKAALSRRDPAQQAAMRAFAIRKLTNETRSAIEKTMTEYARGKIPIATLKTNLQAVIRRQALAAAVIGVGGVGNLTDNVLQAVQRQLSVQFEKLDGFINRLSERELTQRDRATSLLYANSSHMISQTAQRQFNFDTYGEENLEERRFLGGSEHCDDCIAYAAEGWVPAGSLPAPGEGSVCGASCRCTLETRPVTIEQSQPVPGATG